MPALNKQRICPACKGVQPKAEDKDEHIENEKNHPSWTQKSSRRETQAIAAHLLASVLSHLHMHKNSRELNLIDLEPLVHNIVITGGETMIQGWDNDFETELAALAKDFKFTVLKVIPCVVRVSMVILTESRLPGRPSARRNAPLRRRAGRPHDGGSQAPNPT